MLAIGVLSVLKIPSVKRYVRHQINCALIEAAKIRYSLSSMGLDS